MKLGQEKCVAMKRRRKRPSLRISNNGGAVRTCPPVIAALNKRTTEGDYGLASITKTIDCPLISRLYVTGSSKSMQGGVVSDSICFMA